MSVHKIDIDSIVLAEVAYGEPLTIQTRNKGSYAVKASPDAAANFIDDLIKVAEQVRTQMQGSGWSMAETSTPAETLDTTKTQGPMIEASGISSGQWEYKHVYVSASKAKDKVGWGTSADVTTYPVYEIQDTLNDLGQQGWELLTMEPHWFYERVGISMAVEIARPKAITGWYCTFRRRLG